MKKIVKIVNDNYIRYMNDEHNNRYRYIGTNISIDIYRCYKVYWRGALPKH